MFKNNKGVTLTMLLVTVVIMFVIVSATITTGYSLLRNTQKNRLKANLKQKHYLKIIYLMELIT